MNFPEIYLWVGFNLFVLAMLALDLFVVHRNPHEVKFKESLIWSAIWIGLALSFNAGIYYFQGKERAFEFLTGYLIEKSLSVDNIFVFLMIFAYFKVPAKYQHEVLFWGIIGALLMRAGFIAGGIALIKNFHWIIYVFGALLIITGIKMALSHNKEINPENNPLIRWFHKVIPVTKDYMDGKFFVVQDGRWFATPLFVVLIAIETTDLIFAVDSIPAILAITKDPFIVYTSNVFAILGLRSLYFALAGIMHLFCYLHYGLSAILIFVGGKMIVSDVYKVSIGLSLTVIFILIAISVTASVLWPQKKKMVV